MINPKWLSAELILRQGLLFSAAALPLCAQWMGTVSTTGLTASYAGAPSVTTTNYNINYFTGSPSNCTTQHFNPGSVNSLVGTNGFQQIYLSGLPDSVTLQIKYDGFGTSTLHARVQLTNNDTTDHVCNVTIPIWPLNIGSNTIPELGEPTSQANLIGVPALFAAGSWGSLASWTDFTAAGETLKTNAWTTGSNIYSFSTQTVVGSTANPPLIVNEAPIAPGQTAVYNIWLRMGTSSDTVNTLAPEAAAAWAAALPVQYRHPDRRPSCAWFMSSSTNRSATNPRGYFKTTEDPVHNPAGFLNDAIATAQTVINECRAINGQSVMIWDMEGASPAGLTYIGDPADLATLAPDMDAIIGKLIFMLQNAGLTVGITLRPQTILFATPGTLPATCNGGSGNTNYNDVLYNVANAGYTDPHLTYWCKSANTWTPTGGGPGKQTSLTSEAAITANLERKMNVALLRWGVSQFYVDTSAYGNGAAFPYQLWQQIQSDLPWITVWPELVTNSVFAVTGAYLSPNNKACETYSSARTLLSGAWSMLAYSPSLCSAAGIVDGIAHGDVYLMNSWYNNQSDVSSLNAAFAAAQMANSTMVLTDLSTGKNMTYSGDPGSVYKYPLYMRVYFSDTAANIRTSTTWCQQQNGATCYVGGVMQPGSAIDLSSFTAYEVRYFDFTNTFVSSGTAGTM